MEKRVVLQVKKAQSIWEKTKGLIGENKPYAIFFETRFGIHTFGMHFPIDVIILDNKNQVILAKEHILPNKLVFWNPRYKKVIELPEGFIKKKKIQKGTRLLLV